MKPIITRISFLIILFSVSNLYSQYRLSDAFPYLSTPFVYTTEMVHSYDGTNRIFVVTKDGRIYVFNNSPAVTTARLFLDMSDSVSQSGFNGETGLLGLAFHPNYENNRYFYVDYTTRQLPLRSKISRFTTSASNPDSAIRNSEFVLLTLNQPYSNHNGGKIAFGSDNFLYISFGDGGSAGDPLNNAQNRQVLLGKMLRINIDSAGGGNNYSIPVTNPYYSNTQGYRQEIWAYGLRNPWKFSFDAPTNRLWAGDVGQGLYEEIDIILPGRNYGWRIMEGFHCYNPPTNCDTTGLTMPLWEYSHTFGCSITGGYVYHGASSPLLTGKYIYADWCNGTIWALTYDGISPPVNQFVYDTTLYISSFGVDQNNELYVCGYSATGGRFYKIIPDPIGIINNQIPLMFSLEQNYPNPFNPVTSIKYSIPEKTFVTIKIFDVLGNEIETLVSSFKVPGNYEVKWKAAQYPSGVYFYQMVTGTQTFERKMMLLK